MANEITIKVKAIDAASGVFNAITSRLGESGRLIQQIFTGNFAGAIETGVGMAIDYTADAIDKVIELDGKIGDLSLKTGQSLEESSKLIQAAKDAEVSYADLSNALGNATKKGVDVSIESLLDLADEYKEIHDPIDRAKWLTDNFGAAGEGLAPIFEGGSERIVTAMDNVNEALVWDEEKQKEIEEYKKAVGELQTSFEGLNVSVGLDTIELLVRGINKLVDWYDSWKTKNKEVSRLGAELYAQMGLTTPAIKIYGDNIGTAGAQAGLSAELLDVFKESTYEAGNYSHYASIQVDELATSIENLPTEKTITITTNYVDNHTGPGGGTPTVGYEATFNAPLTEITADQIKGRAGGGPVFAGVPYLVGERGPEPFFPAQNGRILSNTEARAALSGRNDDKLIEAVRQMAYDPYENARILTDYLVKSGR